MSGELLLGVDGGGTSTRAWLTDPDGRITGRGVAGPSNPTAVGYDAAYAAIEQAIGVAYNDARQGRRPASVACLGSAGFGRRADQERLREWCERARLADRLILVTDAELALAAGTDDGVGVAVIAGTGSLAFGRGSDGRTARAGGWGHLVGDEGSAYAVALEALRQVTRLADGRLPPSGPGPQSARIASFTTLSKAILLELSIERASDLPSVLYRPDFDRWRIAALAPMVVAHADEHPALAAALLEPAGRELADCAAAVVRALSWSAPVLPVALAGGFVLSSRVVRESLLARLASSVSVRLRATEVPEPVSGAIVLARQEIRSCAQSQPASTA
jgi:N-acetylglucosamine kinase-like BadF-type ATPase